MATKSNRRIQIQTGGGGLTAPKISGGDGNYLERMMYAQSKGMMDAQMSQQKAQQTQASLPEGSYQTAAKDAMGNMFETPGSRFGTADAQNQLTRIKQLKSVVKGVQDLGNTLPTDPIRAFAGSFGAEKAFGRFNTSQWKTYMDVIPTASAGAYRAVTGDNRLSDADAASRAKPLFWDPREPGDVREGKNSFLNYMMDEAENGLTYKAEPKDDMESMIRWQDYVDKAKRRFSEGIDVKKEKNDARIAIENGEDDPEKIKMLFKQTTGFEYDDIE